MTPVEMELFNAIEKRGRVDFAGAGRVIGAAFLTEQLLRGNEDRPRTLALYDVAVVGELDLEASAVGFPVEFVRCSFDSEPNFEQASVAGLYFTDCRLPGFRASQVRVQDGLALDDCQVNGCVQLTGAHVAGQLNMRDCVITGGAEGALEADGLRVDQDAYLCGRFRVTGLARMIGAHLGGEFVCDGAVFRNPGVATALDLRSIVVKEHVLWRRGFSVEGAVNLSGSDIGGQLLCHGARFYNLRGPALDAPGMKVRQQAEFTEECTAIGELNLVACEFGGWLSFTGGTFRNPGGMAINLQLASTAMNLTMRGGTVVHGKLCLSNARVGGAVRAQGGLFWNRFETAIEALGLRVHGELSLGTQYGVRFRSQGQVVFSEAHVGGNFDCTDGWFENEERDALVARGIRVDRNVALRNGFSANGRVDFAGASVDGKVDLRHGRFESRTEAVRCDRIRVGHAVKFDHARVLGGVQMRDAHVGTEVTFDGAVIVGSPALKLTGTQIRSTLRLAFAEKPVGPLDLRQVTTGSFDDRDGDWPEGTETRLDDFVYGALHDDSVKVPKRLEWLRTHHKYVPQVYLQLASTYARAGRQDEATDVLMAKEDVRRRSLNGFFGSLHRIVWLLLSPTVGYGYRPLRILWWLGALVLVGGPLFHGLAENPDNFAPVRKDVQDVWFNPWLYTIDLLLPIMSLEHSQLWVPLHGARWASLAFTVLGWVLAVCLVTGIGRLFKRDER
ncbi:hypothetical protein [Lentzea sp. HUAS12]|uniref:hypothetical protein n=1 Tax=Lentzea sp. HUAS12 TaxID=2951806 RepID=UPI00209C7723|nr:hypothetical protein [Lentzea sp. HUAS12]USX52206.1 hypothetical protein ND450_43975 [Lentzea sp. HUAS12]